MNVEIDVEHPEPGPPRPGDRQGGIVVDTEPRGSVRHRMVQAPARVEGMGRLAGEDRLDRLDTAARNRRGRVVHTREGRRVTRPKPSFARSDRRFGSPSHDADVGRVVDPGEDGIARRLRGQERGRARAHRRQEIDPRPEPARRERMRRPEVVARGPRPVHERRPIKRRNRGAVHQRAPYPDGWNVRACRAPGPRPRHDRAARLGRDRRQDPSGTITTCPTRWCS